MKRATKINIALLALTLSASGLYAQQGFGTATPNKASVIDMKSNTKGLLIPRVALTSTTVFAPIAGALPSTANSLLVYNTNKTGDVIEGFYYWTSADSKWNRLIASNDGALSLVGDVNGALGSNTITKIQSQPVTFTGATSGQVITWNGSAWVPADITAANVKGGKNIVVNDGLSLTGGAASLLTDATIGITNGGIKPVKIERAQGTLPLTAPQVMVTQTNGTVAWVPQSSLVPATTNILASNSNTLTSTVNGVSSVAPIVNTVANTVSGSSLTTTVNGVAGTIDLASVIQAGQKTTTLSDGTNTTVGSTVTGNVTDYKVNVATATNTGNLGVVKQAATNPTVNIDANGVLSVNTTATGIGKTLKGDGVTVTAGTTAGTTTSVVQSVLADVTLGIADNAITTNKIANNAVTIGKLPTGATATTFLRGDGSWVTPTDTNTTYTGSTSVILNGSSFERAALTGDVTAPQNSNVTTIAPNAVTSAKIADGTIVPADIASPGNNKVLTSNASGAPIWVDQSAISNEPWNVQNTSNQATSNTQNIYQQGNVALGTISTDPVRSEKLYVKGQTFVEENTMDAGAGVSASITNGNFFTESYLRNSGATVANQKGRAHIATDASTASSYRPYVELFAGNSMEATNNVAGNFMIDSNKSHLDSGYGVHNLIATQFGADNSTFAQGKNTLLGVDANGVKIGVVQDGNNAGQPFRYTSMNGITGQTYVNAYYLPRTAPTTGQVLTYDSTTSNLGSRSEVFTKWANVSDLVPASSTASNGLTKVVNDIQLGGDLTKATTITNNGNAFTIATNGTPTSITGLPNVATSATDRVIIADANGVLKQVKSVMPSFFYMPAIVIPTHNTSTGSVLTSTQTIELYTLYSQQFNISGSGTTGTGWARSNASSTLPTLPANQLDYFITYYDTDVYQNVAVSATGQLTYTVKSTAVVTPKTFMNIVFKVRD
ncbi:hypothetical protein H1R17_04010 [Flavobacterium sp. xlx-214]|uniref:beta strand repeat-containing protein n=1 Tax=unclassified Flavobacterium TaxID=196869 RepID=UPI0013D6A0BE|nr:MULTISPECIES: hypothetical protein [unclassified Flavobacterium]MBA5792057.1 hypothetical protein [Flavobacterium sp. xlx-221]QMI84306.1 hypothetical protein H1R17_04010 [Flavobacterium sp. xlx-214]